MSMISKFSKLKLCKLKPRSMLYSVERFDFGAKMKKESVVEAEIKIQSKSKTKPKVGANSASKKFKEEAYFDDYDNEDFKVDMKIKPELIGKLPLDYPLDLSSFPKIVDGMDPFEAYKNSKRTLPNSHNVMKQDLLYNSRNFAPLAVAIKKANGNVVEDIEGYRYLDCLMGNSSIIFGHKNKNIESVILEQVQQLTMTSRAFYNNKLFEGTKFLNKAFGYDKCILMNTGSEAGETAIKLARRWGYRNKRIPENKAKCIFVTGNFWGRSITACGTSDDPLLEFGPYEKESFYIIPYNDVNSLIKILKNDPDVCSIMLEPIQGEAGVVIPDNNYIDKVYDLCKKYNILYIDDEVQSGIGRSGKLLAYEWFLKDGKRPDIVIVAKALSNGYQPVSAVLSTSEIIDLIGPGEHGSTYSGNPLGMAIIQSSLNELISLENDFIRNCAKMGSYLGLLLSFINSPLIKEIRGRGLFIGIEFHSEIPIQVSDIVLHLMERGLLTRQTNKYCLILTPAINITFKEVEAIFHIFKFVLKSIENQIVLPKLPKARLNILCTQNDVKEMNSYIASKPEIAYVKRNPLQSQFINIITKPGKASMADSFTNKSNSAISIDSNEPVDINILLANKLL